MRPCVARDLDDTLLQHSVLLTLARALHLLSTLTYTPCFLRLNNLWPNDLNSPL